MLAWIAKHLKRRDITGEAGELYLTRYRILGWMPGSTWRWPFSIYLHRFHREDLDDAPHNHPWHWAVSIILSGSYLEVRMLDSARVGENDRELSGRWLHRFSVGLLTQKTFHYVSEVRGEVWTLFIVGPRTSSWGFWVPGRGFIGWRERLRERGIEPSY